MSKRLKKNEPSAPVQATTAINGDNSPSSEHVLTLMAADLDDRQLRGIAIAAEAERSNGIAVPFSETETWWTSSRGNRLWKVFRDKRNLRGKRSVQYRCTCADFKKFGRDGCLHTFAEQIRRGEIVVEGDIPTKRVKQTAEGRRAPRVRNGANGETIKTLQRKARMALGDRIPELVVDLKRRLDRENPAMTKRDKHMTSRAIALVLKISHGLSADEMTPVYRRLIEDGTLRLRKVPSQNTLSRWVNDPRLTPLFHRMLDTTAQPFRAREKSAIVDSSKMSQMRSAHARWVEYENDEREGADWMKMHAIVGLETLICMAVVFSGMRGVAHDSKFIIALVERAQRIFNIQHVLADKAYLSEAIVGRLWELGVRACIPLKKKVDVKTKKRFYEAYDNLAQWFDGRRTEFDEMYRFRVKVESFFSLVKRVADGYCWSRGRPHKDADGKLRYGGNGSAAGPCTAWQNETLCKVIYVNLRLTVEHETRTGYRMNYLTDTFFPELPPEERAIA